MLRDFLRVLLRQADFTIRIKGGRACLWQGKAPKGFVDDCDLIAVDQQLQTGLIFGCQRSRGLVLEFSQIPESCHQRFRNVWQIHQR